MMSMRKCSNRIVPHCHLHRMVIQIGLGKSHHYIIYHSLTLTCSSLGWVLDNHKLLIGYKTKPFSKLNCINYLHDISKKNECKQTKFLSESFTVLQFCDGGWSVFLQSSLRHGCHATPGLRQSCILEGKQGCLKPIDEGLGSHIPVSNCFIVVCRCKQIFS